jgi:DNA-binding transcriptional LysR family regulator
MTDMKQAQAGPVQLPPAGAGAPQGLELRHLRYFVALADAGNFTHAAERMYIAQPTLSQQIRRLEEIIGTPLLQRRREGLRLTQAGMVLLDASREVLSLVDHGMSETRQAAGLGRHRPGSPARPARRHEPRRVRTRGVDPGHPPGGTPRDHQPE